MSNYKILKRWYYTPQLLHKYYPNTTDSCWRCQAARGTLLHIFWACPMLNHFWSTVRTITQKFTEHKIPDYSAFFLLHVTTIPAKQYKKSLMQHLPNAAKSRIPLFWKTRKPPSIGTWLCKIEDIN